MKNLILDVALKVLFPLLIIASIMSLFRGHNEPGGGFIGGLVAASAFILLTFAQGVRATEERIPVKPRQFVTIGLICAIVAALFPLASGLTFFEAMWLDIEFPLVGSPGTPLLFDIGVYLVVIGAVCSIIFSIGD